MLSVLDNIQDNINEIDKTFKYTNFIKQIIFDNYANITPGTVINFEFPLTVFVGRNGCNKTRALQAIYGIPNGTTVGDFWFNTSLDPISIGPLPKFTYVYSDENDEKLLFPVIYNRAKRENDPDYWETRKLTKNLKEKFSLPKDRYPPIEKNLLYIDSKVELSAYDIFFNFNNRDKNHKTNYRENKRIIRKKATQLKQSLETGKIYRCKNKEQNNAPENIETKILMEISCILGKSYQEAKQIFHKQYHFWGESLFLNEEYSEARAGSGELKIFNLVKKVMAAPHHSLILLDEPEVSLHPGAQLQLVNFLLQQIICKKHQIILTTHSPTLISCLPDKAIKLFQQSAVNNTTFSILEDISPRVAFENFGEPIQNDKINILVEDCLAQQLVQKVITSSNELSNDTFNITYLQGGVDDIYTRIIPLIMNIDSNIFVILDGDQNPPDKDKDEYDYQKIPLYDMNNPDKYKTKLCFYITKLIKTKDIKKINFSLNSNHNTQDDTKTFKYIYIF